MTIDADDTSALRIALDLREIAAFWMDLDQLTPCADNVLAAASPLKLGRPCSFDRLASAETILSGSSSTVSIRSYDDASDGEATRPPRGATQQRGATKMAWTAEEDRIIAEGVAMYGNKWSRIRKMLPATSSCRTEDSVRNRWQRLQRKQSRRAAKAACAGEAPSAAKGVSKYGDMWSAQEDDEIERGVIAHGLLFREVAAQLPGRTESGVRNRWLRNQQKRLAARGVHVSGAPATFAALRASGELGENGQYRPLVVGDFDLEAPDCNLERPSGGADAFGEYRPECNLDAADCNLLDAPDWDLAPLAPLALVMDAGGAQPGPPADAIKPHRQHASLA